MLSDTCRQWKRAIIRTNIVMLYGMSRKKLFLSKESVTMIFKQNVCFTCDVLVLGSVKCALVKS